jgi:propanediol dehydratase large subunit
MKRESRFGLLAACSGIMILGGLLVVPAPSIAKTIKGHIVDIVAENIGNITVTIRTAAGETKTFKASDWRLTANLHFNEPVTIEVDDQGNVKSITGEWQTLLKEMLKLK